MATKTIIPIIDARLNVLDAPGDEGEIFSALVRGQNLTAQDLGRINTENDWATSTVENKMIALEQSASPPLVIDNPNPPETIITREQLEALGFQFVTLDENYQETLATEGAVLIARGPSPSELNLKIPFNVNAADTTNAEKLQPGGSSGLNLTGTGVVVGVWDGGDVRGTHQELTPRVTDGDGATGVSDHATHVAGTIGATGVVANAKGMANQVQIRSYDWDNDIQEMSSAPANLNLSNHSYGYLAGWTTGISWRGLPPIDTWMGDRSVYAVEDPNFGNYDNTAKNLDQLLVNKPNYLSVWAAGNDRNDKFFNISGNSQYVTYLSSHPSGAGYYLVSTGQFPAPPGDGNGGTGYDSLPYGYSMAKNNLVIGAINDITADPYNNSHVGMSSFSSWGPTDDGRVKPDLVANGVGVYSTIGSSNSAYASYNGTSMAAPNATGTIALLYQHHNNLSTDPDYRQYQRISGNMANRFQNIAHPRSATIKGLAIHTAFDAGNVGPDYAHGWGVLDGANAANFLTNLANNNRRDLLAEDTYRGTEIPGRISYSGVGPIKVTLVWTDPPLSTVPAKTLDNPTSVLVNDLDLWVSGPNGTVYRPWTLNPANPGAAAVRNTTNHRDNVEQVVIDSGVAGNYAVHVGHTALASGFTSQDFSIFTTATPEIGKAHAWGDVHFVTFDGRTYDQQSVGDFILVRSTDADDNWQIQTRQEPWIQNPNVSINDAFATTVDNHIVIFDQDFDSDRKLKIDGNQVTLTSGQSLIIGNSQISRQGNVYTLIYAGFDGMLSTADDDQVIARDNGDHINIEVLPSNSRATRLQGLLGNADGLGSNDFALRDGTLLPADPSWDQLHGEYAASWRVRQGESLFDTASQSAPSPPRITLDDLPHEEVQAAIAAAIAVGIPDPALDSTALDLVITKNQGFLDGAADMFSPKLSITSSALAEENSGSHTVRLFVNLSIPCTRIVTVDYATQDGTGIHPAIAGSDYTATSGKLTFYPGTTALTLDVPILGDEALEFDETFFVNLTNPYGAILETSQGNITILNDDISIPPTFVGTNGNDIFTGGNDDDIINGREGDDSLNGGAGDDILNGGPGKDILTGDLGADTFVYTNFSDSLFANPDRLRSFNPGEGDHIYLRPIPTATFNRGIVSAANLTAAVTAVYADADPTTPGEQALGVNQAAFFSFGATTATRRSYLAVNDIVPGFNGGSDLFIEVTGMVGTLPSGPLTSSHYFI